MVSAEEWEEKFYPSHWKRRLVFVVVKKSSQPRLGFVHKRRGSKMPTRNPRLNPIRHELSHRDILLALNADARSAFVLLFQGQFFVI